MRTDRQSCPPSPPRSPRRTSAAARVHDDGHHVSTFIRGHIRYVGAFFAGAFILLVALVEGGVGPVVVVLIVSRAANWLRNHFVQSGVMGNSLPSPAHGSDRHRPERDFWAIHLCRRRCQYLPRPPCRQGRRMAFSAGLARDVAVRPARVRCSQSTRFGWPGVRHRRHDDRHASRRPAHVAHRGRSGDRNRTARHRRIVCLGRDLVLSCGSSSSATPLCGCPWMPRRVRSVTSPLPPTPGTLRVPIGSTRSVGRLAGPSRSRSGPVVRGSLRWHD